ncbi:hypothetical protein PTSG_10551 [Salpingoeca rosetta]|uniref:Growth hormone-inducible transmembrane protein n=1 Tax=Salpingoeca rosetta (strain ATCC 50818 / BSB-021) TaxID=946362 RepID=F2URP0_SALR5|nr:uncharacterized protein PTSG_10551 [Salpingoeca rosetta]EGD80295.1 hypothetical protein PTSG_10551 [Salpingoeca rosetta]|eukprot:XP_004988085.1 hypothetical protein PTSG_10551 [Salpingoeca rosetta]
MLVASTLGRTALRCQRVTLMTLVANQPRISAPSTLTKTTQRAMATFRTSRAATARVANATATGTGARAASGSNTRRLVLGGLAGAGIITVGLMGATMVRGLTEGVHDNTMWAPYVHERVASTFTALGVGIGITAVATIALFRTGAVTFIAARPIVSMVVSLGGMIAASTLTRSIDPANLPLKYASLALFNSVVAFTLTPLMLLGGPLLLRAAAMTGGIVGSLCLVASNSPSDTFLAWAGPLSMGLGAVVISSLGAAFLPSMAVASVLHQVSLYGGLVLFSGFVLFDTARIVEAAKHAPANKFDPVGASISIYMDAINIFVRIAQIMAMSGGNRRK